MILRKKIKSCSVTGAMLDRKFIAAYRQIHNNLTIFPWNTLSRWSKPKMNTPLKFKNSMPRPCIKLTRPRRRHSKILTFRWSKPKRNTPLRLWSLTPKPFTNWISKKRRPPKIFLFNTLKRWSKPKKNTPLRLQSWMPNWTNFKLQSKLRRKIFKHQPLFQQRLLSRMKT